MRGEGVFFCIRLLLNIPLTLSKNLNIAYIPNICMHEKLNLCLRQKKIISGLDHFPSLLFTG